MPAITWNSCCLVVLLVAALRTGTSQVSEARPKANSIKPAVLGETTTPATNRTTAVHPGTTKKHNILAQVILVIYSSELFKNESSTERFYAQHSIGLKRRDISGVNFVECVLLTLFFYTIIKKTPKTNKNKSRFQVFSGSTMVRKTALSSAARLDFLFEKLNMLDLLK